MQPLIKITSDPIRIMRYTQNARLINSNSVDIERRKALARHRTMQASASRGSVSVEELAKINRTFSSRSNVNVTPQVQSSSNTSFQQMATRQAQAIAAQPNPAKTASASANLSASSSDALVSTLTDPAVTTAAVSAASATPGQNISMNPGSSYTAERGAFEMRVAKGELTYLPPMVMTIITQRPQVHVEYLGGYNYLPPMNNSGGNVNLFT